MTTRRTALGLLAAAAGSAALGGTAACDRKTGPAQAGPGPERLIVQTGDGSLAVFATGRTIIPAAGSGVLAANGTSLIRSQPAGAHTEVIRLDVGTSREVSRIRLAGALTPRAASPDGRLVALATPSGLPPYRPAGRTATTLAVADPSGERMRMRLPGNLEPEAFTPEGDGLFVLDYLPPTAPDRYRVRLLTFADGRIRSLSTRNKRPIPPGAEEEMRGEGRQAVYHDTRGLLFTLYTHQPDHVHTRDLLRGVRPGAAHVHAFVHTLSLRERWAFCIDLPAPFGEPPAAGHAIALSPDGMRLAVVETTTGTAAFLDPQDLTIRDLARFSGAEGVGAAAFTPQGALVVGAGRQVSVVPDGPRFVCGSAVRGLVVHPDGRRVYVGQVGEVVCHELATGRVVGRITTPGLTTLRHLTIAG